MINEYLDFEWNFKMLVAICESLVIVFNYFPYARLNSTLKLALENWLFNLIGYQIQTSNMIA